MIDTFAFKFYAEELPQALSEISQLYFNRLDDELQPYAAKTVGKILDAMLNKGNSHFDTNQGM